MWKAESLPNLVWLNCFCIQGSQHNDLKFDNFFLFALVLSCCKIYKRSLLLTLFSIILEFFFWGLNTWANVRKCKTGNAVIHASKFAFFFFFVCAPNLFGQRMYSAFYVKSFKMWKHLETSLKIHFSFHFRHAKKGRENRTKIYKMEKGCVALWWMLYSAGMVNSPKLPANLIFFPAID